MRLDGSTNMKDFEVVADYHTMITIFAACDTPTDVFITLLEPVLENITYQSILMYIQYRMAKWVLNLKKSELLFFFGNKSVHRISHASKLEALLQAIICVFHMFQK